MLRLESLRMSITQKNSLSIYARERSELGEKHAGVGVGFAFAGDGSKKNRSPSPTQSILPFCAGVQFSRDSLRAFND